MSYMLCMLLAILSFGIIMLIAAKEDLKSYDVSGELCVIWWVMCFACEFFMGRNWIIITAMIFMCVVFYYPKDIPFFGDADILPFASYLAVYVNSDLNYMAPLLYLFALGLSLVPYGVMWGRKNGVRWYIGSKIEMPVLPCFAAAWIISGICYFVLAVMIGV